MNLLIEMKTKGETNRVWRLRPDSELHTIGQSRNADIRTASQDINGIFAALEFQSGRWLYTQLATVSNPITPNGDVSFYLEKPFSIAVGETEIFITPVDIKVSLFGESNLEEGDKATWALIYAGNVFIESRVLMSNEPLVFADQVITLNPGKNWSEQSVAEYTVKSRIVYIPKSEDFSKADKSSFIDPGLEKFLVGTVAAILIFVIAVILLKPKTPPPQPVVNVKEFNTVVLKKPEEKKAPKENAVSKAMAQALPPQQASGGGGKNIGSVISKIRTANLSNLIAKVSAQARRSANVVITSKGESAASASPTGRAMSAISKLAGKGTDWRAEGQGSGIAAGLGGVGGKMGGQYGDLNAGAVGSGGVGLIEDESEIVGGLDREVIAAYIKSQLGQILFCYERQLSATPDLFGKVAVKFTILGDGFVEGQRIGESSLRNQNVESCILQRVAKWRFPKPEGGTKVVVTYPFLFKSTN